jgi:hypothetical protein
MLRKAGATIATGVVTEVNNFVISLFTYTDIFN